jgi:hypothetical protein
MMLAKNVKVSRLKIYTVLILSLVSCKKSVDINEAKLKPPVRIYMVTARIDKKGTNSNSEGTAILKGNYDEETKTLNYSIEYKNLNPTLICLRSGTKGSVGTLIKDLYKKSSDQQTPIKFSGTVAINPLQERNLLKGLWFTTISTSNMNPEISGILTLKQKE